MIIETRLPSVWAPHQRGFGEYWCRISGNGNNDKIIHALAFMVWISDQGHIHLPTKKAMELWNQKRSTWLARSPQGVSWPGPDNILEVLNSLPENLISEGPHTPLRIFKGKDHYYYLQRHYEEEHTFCSRLKVRISSPLPWAPLTPSDKVPGWASLNLRQKKAVEGCLSKSFFILSGGPGTGKTYCLFQVLLQLLSVHPNTRIALAAPTGRSAARIKESLGMAISKLGQQDSQWEPILQTIQQIPSQTVHRLLDLWGPKKTSETKTALALDLIILDEASMVELGLMSELLKRLPPTCALILVGDKDQLPSVETGAILGDLTRLTSGTEGNGNLIILTDNQRLSSSKNGNILNDLFKNVIGFQFPVPLPGEVFNQPPILSSSQILEEWIATTSEDFSFIQSLDKKKIFHDLALTSPLYRKDFNKKCIEPLDVDEVLDCLDQSVLLSCLKKGPMGTDSLNNDFLKDLQGQWAMPGPGTPWMITTNLKDWGIFNGDRGLLIQRHGSLLVFFPGSGADKHKSFPFALLQGHGEPSWTMTVHKSQGSEFEQVFLVLPEGAENLMTREILYTGLTRAKKSVKVYSQKELIEKTLQNRVVRYSLIEEWFSTSFGLPEL